MIGPHPSSLEGNGLVKYSAGSLWLGPAFSLCFEFSMPTINRTQLKLKGTLYAVDWEWGDVFIPQVS